MVGRHLRRASARNVTTFLRRPRIDQAIPTRYRACRTSFHFKELGRTTTLAALTVSVVTAAALCLLFPETRSIGVACAAVLSFMQPLLLNSVVAAAAMVAATVF